MAYVSIRRIREFSRFRPVSSISAIMPIGFIGVDTDQLGTLHPTHFKEIMFDSFPLLIGPALGRDPPMWLLSHELTIFLCFCSFKLALTITSFSNDLVFASLALPRFMRRRLAPDVIQWLIVFMNFKQNLIMIIVD